MTAPEVGARPPPVGGFFEAHAPSPAAGGESVLSVWTRERPYAAFVNARSAFAALAARRRDAAVWLPAFLCRDLLVPALAERVRFYPVADDFAPELMGVEADAREGDIVLVVAYFGAPLAPEVRTFAARRPDLILVEDRAQALAAGPAVPGAWTLHSPRKLLGVADGGLLVAPEGGEPPPACERADAEILWRAPLMRAADPQGLDNAAWHAANQAKEAAMAASEESMTERSLAVLAETPLAALAASRLANWRQLDETLRHWSALPAAPTAPPLGYVLQVAPERRERLLSALHAERIFAAVHWPQIAGPAAAFPREARWARELITLPCDHRYGPGEMARVAARTAELLA